MRKDYPALFHDIISSPQNTTDVVVLSEEGCNILNFGPNTYKHVPIDYDDYLDVLFVYEHDDFFYILGISQLLIIYICLFVLGMDREAHD